MTIITVASQKGGVWKTSTAVALAHGLANAGAPGGGSPLGATLLCDLDPQGHAAISLGQDPEPGIFDFFVTGAPLTNLIRSTRRDGLYLLPGNSRTKTAETVLRHESSLAELTAKLKSLVEPYAFAVLDTAATGLLQEMAIAALGPQDVLIIPAQLEALGLDGVAGVMQMVRRLGKPGRIIILPTGYDSRIKEHETNFISLHQAYPGLITHAVPRRAAVAEAAGYGRTVWETNARGIKDVTGIYAHVLNLIGDFNLEALTCQK